MMNELIWQLPDLQATELLAQKIAPLIQAQDVILLYGTLGVGKTSFARALLRELCADQEMEVPSPSFTLVQIYDAEHYPIYHYDLWRIANEDELIELDWEDAREGVALVEWPERLGSLTPPDALSIEFYVESENMRSARLSGWDEQRLNLVK